MEELKFEEFAVKSPLEELELQRRDLDAKIEQAKKLPKVERDRQLEELRIDMAKVFENYENHVTVLLGLVQDMKDRLGKINILIAFSIFLILLVLVFLVVKLIL